MGHLMNTEFVHWNGRSYKVKGRDKVDMDRIMSNYRPFQVETPGPTTAVGPAPKTKITLVHTPKPKAKAKKPKN